MKRLARLPGLKYTFYGVFCLFFSTFIAAATGFIYCITRGHFNSAPPEGAGFESFAYGMRYIFGVITVSCGVIAALMLIFVLIGAGRRRGDDELHTRKIDRIPYEFCIAIYGALIYGIVYLCIKVLQDPGLWNLFVIVPLLLLGSLFFEELCISTAIRYKSDTLFKNSFTYRVFALLKQIYDHFTPSWKLTLAAAAYFGATYYVFSYMNAVLLTVWGLLSIVLCVLTGASAVFLDSIKQGSKELAAGNLEHKIDTVGMFSRFAEIGDDLNHISEGMSKAVSEKTRSERLRTELITNVSHDIKTPLTSIVNYVDLLKRGNLSESQRAEYLSVLDRQSQKLKKLVVDLVEASKAITGNITANPAPTNLNELVNQSVAEYADRFAEKSLEAIVAMPENAVTANADGRLTWRIFDNLLGNICKYSMPGTRVYTELAQNENTASVVFKNISETVLNISPDELVERFVRGDSSRSTEGSGLGLSIATSLAEIQQGRLAIDVDGDLFKASLYLPLAAEDMNESISDITSSLTGS
ncbi:MAG: HAMP domain-containing histidine kinase [Clostridia bacterium]|nr:HAMP domain-containing histidine kinase [Clostridia bacterium]